MHTLKKFIPYYSPYKAVFFLDLICAAAISLIDLAYPQILRTMTRGGAVSHIKGIAADRSGYAVHVHHSGALQILCQLSGTYDGSQYGTGYAAAAF